MENRFGFRELVICLLLLVLILSVWAAMTQFDRQYRVVQRIADTMDKQVSEQARLRQQVHAIERALADGVSITAGSASTRPADAGQAVDPFARTKAAQEKPDFAMGDWYVSAFSVNVAKISPLVSGDVYASDIQSEVLESLAVRHPVTLEWTPWLARSWTISPDGLTITFRLRNDVVFSDGEPLTAADVVFSYELIMNPKIDAPRERAYYDKIASVTATGPHEVIFVFKEPYFESFGLAAGLGIMPKHFYSQFTPDEYNRSTGYLLGSGPYRLPDPKGWRPGDLLQLVRNERYWGVPAFFNRLVYREITNDVARLTAFRNGETDAFAAQPEQYRKLLADPEFMAKVQQFEYDSPAAGYNYLAWNQRRNGKATRFADVRVRQAMTYLTDRQKICQQIMLGYATPATGPFNRLGKQYDQSIEPRPHDAAKAAELLKQAGFQDRNGDGVLDGPDGQPFRFKLTYPSGSTVYDQIVFFLKDSYAKAGIVLDPDPLDWAVFGDRLKTHDFDVISLGWSGGIEGDIFQMFHSTQIADGGDNFVSYSNPKLDKLIEQARSSVDEEKRMPLWKECHRILYEDQPYTFLTTRKSLIFIDERIANVEKVTLGLNSRIEWYVPQALQKPSRD